MTLLMEPVMYMIMALGEKAELDFKIDSGDKDNEGQILGDEAVNKIEKEVGSLDAIRRQAASRVSPQSVPTEVRKVIEETNIEPSILERVEKESNKSLLAKEV